MKSLLYRHKKIPLRKDEQFSETHSGLYFYTTKMNNRSIWRLFKQFTILLDEPYHFGQYVIKEFDHRINGMINTFVTLDEFKELVNIY